MADNIEIYNILLEEIKRLKGKEISSEERTEIFNEYIYRRVPDEEMNKFMKGKKNKLITVSLPDGLDITPILKQTLKLIGIMDLCDNWGEFLQHNNKKKPPADKELTDFDKILKGLSQVPKPPKTNKPSE